MLSENEVRALIKDMESDRIERTRSVQKTDKFAEAICAFANDMPNHQLPGYLLIGVDDDGSVAGIQVGDDILQSLGAIRSDGNVLPQPAMTVQRYALQEGDVAIVEVFPSDLPPVRFKGRTYIRVGARKGIANEHEERILSEKRVALAKSFDARPCAEAGIDELALRLFDDYRREAVAAETIAENHRTVEVQLASLRFFDIERQCATNAGVLIFGKNPRFYFPGAYIQYLVMPGTTLTDLPLDQAEISGDLFTVLKEMETRIRAVIRTTLHKDTEFRERAVPDYPEVALRELFLNAVMHRNYESNSPIRFYVFSDHIEIQSPGGLYGEATERNFPTRNSYRNPIIAEALKSLGFVNRFGYGVQRAQEALRQNGNDLARFEFDEHTVLVKLWKRT